MNRPQKLALLGTLYVSQGLPFGFFSQALPVMLRERGVSLSWIGVSALLSLPWALKFLWAPAIDRSALWGSSRRKSWIITMQVLATVLMMSLGFVDARTSLSLLFVGVLLANLFSATQDIATDGLAVELLSESERGLGNGVQVAGYRVGMIVGGGLLLIVFDQVGFRGVFACMAALMFFLTLPIALYREGPSRAHTAEQSMLQAFIAFVNAPEMRGFSVVLAIYKIGDALGTSMLRPRLVDAGYDVSTIGWMLGTIGFAAGLLGALSGGLWLMRLSRARALVSFGILHAFSLAAYILVPRVPTHVVYAITGVEHFAGGMATSALFTMMMDRCRPGSEGTDYTFQACVVVISTGAMAALSGVLAEAVGYDVHFGISAALALGCVSYAGARLSQKSDTTNLRV